MFIIKFCNTYIKNAFFQCKLQYLVLFLPPKKPKLIVSTIVVLRTIQGYFSWDCGVKLSEAIVLPIFKNNVRYKILCNTVYLCVSISISIYMCVYNIFITMLFQSNMSVASYIKHWATIQINPEWIYLFIYNIHWDRELKLCKGQVIQISRRLKGEWEQLIHWGVYRSITREHVPY